MHAVVERNCAPGETNEPSNSKRLAKNLAKWLPREIAGKNKQIVNITRSFLFLFFRVRIRREMRYEESQE